MTTAPITLTFMFAIRSIPRLYGRVSATSDTTKDERRPSKSNMGSETANRLLAVGVSSFRPRTWGDDRERVAIPTRSADIAPP